VGTRPRFTATDHCKLVGITSPVSMHYSSRQFYFDQLVVQSSDFFFD